ncbi:MAG TPA: HEAT repeat domain-containing protein [Pirellulaceae bacterium]|nr:HEAT repeat domain-containing protein [Pirellulaceae bacterium]
MTRVVLMAAPLCFVLLLVAGCGEMPAAASKTPKKASAVAVRPLPEPPKVEQDAYASVDAAMADVESVASAPPEEANAKLLKVETWLNMQGARVAPELEARIKDPSVGLATRLTACRVLARLGPISVPTLLEAADGEPNQLRRKAIECLGRVKPTRSEVVAKLVALTHDDDYEIRKGAFRALTSIGPPAKEHDPQLVALLTSILNDVNEDETVRSLAHDALKKIDPRIGLMGAEKGRMAGD